MDHYKQILRPSMVHDIYVHYVREAAGPVREVKDGARLHHYRNPETGVPFNPRKRLKILGKDTELRDNFHDAVVAALAHASPATI
jgi:hypothetical protein